MEYRIIMDSVGDFTEDMTVKKQIERIALNISMDGEEFVDDGSLNQEVLLKKIKECKECPHSACASPASYLEAYQSIAVKRLYVITGSSKLTGSYGSAKVAEQMYRDENPEGEIVVFDSKSAASGETLLALYIEKMEDEGKSFEEIIQFIENQIKFQETKFILEDLTFLRKNGRLTGLKAILAEKLHFVPLLAADGEGNICQIGKVRGTAKAIRALCDEIAKDLRENPKLNVVVSHCNAIKKAQQIYEFLIHEFNKINVTIVSTGGIATLYAGAGGVVVSY